MNAKLLLLTAFLLGANGTHAQSSPERVLAEYPSPRGDIAQLVLVQNKPRILRVVNLVGHTLWETQPGDEANLRIQWLEKGTILAIITNSQEKDRGLFTPRPGSQNHLFLLDPRDGVILEQADLTTDLEETTKPVAPENFSPDEEPQEHELKITETNGQKILQVKTHEGSQKETPAREGTIPLKPDLQEELDRPKVSKREKSLDFE
jgi:hypothetical protein